MIEVQAEKLTKKFGDFIAVNQVSFSVEKGEVFGFLGPNGAGKTIVFKYSISPFNHPFFYYIKNNIAETISFIWIFFF